MDAAAISHRDNINALVDAWELIGRLPVRRDSPFGILEIELGPPRQAQLPGANERQRRELQRVGGDRTAGIAVDRAQQLADRR